MGNGLEPRVVGRPSWWKRVMRRPDVDAALAEIHNAIASSDIDDLPSALVADVAARTRVSTRALEDGVRSIYVAVLRHFARDSRLDGEELRKLGRLRALLGIRPSDERAAIVAALTPVYRERLGAAISDGTLTESESRGLEELRVRLALPQSVVEEIHREEIGPLIQRILDEAIEDRRLSPVEEERLAIIAGNLGGRIQHDQQTARTLERFRLLWRLDQGELPIVEAPVRLQRSETCHFAMPCGHHEFRTTTRAIQYAGPTVRIPIVRGVSWRMGHLAVNRVTTEDLRFLDAGVLYVTNRRLLFDGGRKTTAILFRRIIRFTVFADGLKIEKDAGKDQYFMTGEGDLEILGAVLDAAMRDCRD